VNVWSRVDWSLGLGSGEFDAAKEEVEAGVVDAFEGASDEEGGAEGAAEGGPAIRGAIGRVR
jgi:hypothetical protein